AFSWLPMKETISDEEIAATADTIDRYLDGWLRPENVGNPEDVLFVGFCQGASLALHVALRQSRPCAGLVLFSGPVLVPELEVKARPPVCVIHGDADPFFPPETLTETVDFLRKAGLEPESHLLPGLGHCIDSRGVAIARDFIARRLAAPRS
ncbi:MAG TPA: dienelactone hydrolase family protein, partial [Myxococcaceae bacterium]|nr:dienelactone hydrolase family protein [Myxococcaceae bacterium]